MSSLTHKELSNFSHYELSLETSKILQNLMNEYRENIPGHVILKLQKVCTNFIEACNESNVELPNNIQKLSDKKSLTITDIFTVIGAVATVISTILAAYSVFSSKPNNNTFINQNITYIINNEYINDINIIINELENSNNISVNTDNNTDDSCSEN